jgi:hypothetical protein
MKKIFAFCLLLSVSGATFSQVDTATLTDMRTDYLKKSKNQKTIAWVMLGGGFTFALIGTTIALNDFSSDLSNMFNPEYKYHDHSAEASIFLITGAASMLGSIPLFISAKHNKDRALSITFKNDLVPAAAGSFIIKKPVQEVSLVLKF